MAHLPVSIDRIFSPVTTGRILLPRTGKLPDDRRLLSLVCRQGALLRCQHSRVKKEFCTKRQKWDRAPSAEGERIDRQNAFPAKQSLGSDEEPEVGRMSVFRLFAAPSQLTYSQKVTHLNF